MKTKMILPKPCPRVSRNERTPRVNPGKELLLLRASPFVVVAFNLAFVVGGGRSAHIGITLYCVVFYLQLKKGFPSSIKIKRRLTTEGAKNVTMPEPAEDTAIEITPKQPPVLSRVQSIVQEINRATTSRVGGRNKKKKE